MLPLELVLHPHGDERNGRSTTWKLDNSTEQQYRQTATTHRLQQVTPTQLNRRMEAKP